MPHIIQYSSCCCLSTGDIVSPPNLDRLLVLPTGCGEQNLGKLTTNLIVGLHLHFTGQLQDHLRVKIRNNIQIGE